MKGGTGLIARFFRWLRRREVRRFHARGWALIPGIPTDAFHAMAAMLESEGWKRYGDYDGIDAWIDQGAFYMRRDGVRLRWKWTDLDEGSVYGPAAAVRMLATRFGHAVQASPMPSPWD